MLGKLIFRDHLLAASRRKMLHKTSVRNSYYYLMPEIPPDTPETNPIMRVNENVPAFSELTPKLVQSGVQKLVINYETEMDSLYKQFDGEKENKYEKTFDSVFKPIEKALAPLDYAQKTARHLAFTFPYSNYHNVFLKLDRKINVLKDERWTNKSLYKALKELNSDRHRLNEKQQRVLDRSLKSCILAGQNLNEAEMEMCRDLSNRIQDRQSQFIQRLDYANRHFGLRISDPQAVESLPFRIKHLISNDRENPDKGPWTVVPREEIFESFMKHCANRNLRRMLFEAYYSRASYVREHFQTNNSEIIKDVLGYRKRQANLYGYKNFAELVIENKAAVKVENLNDLFEKVRVNLRPVADENLKNLEKLAAKNGYSAKLDNYDLDYWITTFNKTNYGVDEAELAPYFPYRKVIDGLFELTKQLFNVKFERDESQNDRMLSKTSEAYNLVDAETGGHISTLVLDPFVNYNHIWGYAGRNSSETANMKPLAYLNLNASNLGQSSSLTFNQVKKLFSEFGGVIQTLLTSTEFIETSDRFMIETDATNVNNHFFRRLVYVPQVMSLITAQSMPNDLLTRLKNYDQNLEVFNLLKQTLYSAFDIECHMSEKFWTEIMDELWPKFMPIPMAKNDYRPCQFRIIFGENFGCNYYTNLWSEMLATDVFEAFNEVGFEDKKRLLDVGLKYRDTFMKNGASLSSNELFRQFRGRNPSMDPFIKSYLNRKL